MPPVVRVYWWSACVARVAFALMKTDSTMLLFALHQCLDDRDLCEQYHVYRLKNAMTLVLLRWGTTTGTFPGSGRTVQQTAAPEEQWTPRWRYAGQHGFRAAATLRHDAEPAWRSGI